MIFNRLWLIIIIGTTFFSARRSYAQCPGRDSFAVSGATCLNKNTTFVNYSNGGADTYDFNWGDGSSKTGITTTASQAHKYTATGIYKVWMVRHFLIPACTDSVSLSITVNPTTPPVASFTYSPTTVFCVGTTITFVDLSTGEHSPTWLWDFGDGTNSTQQNPTHKFYSSGSGIITFTVKLTVANYGGCGTSSATKTIQVKQSVQPQITDSANIFSQFRSCNSTLTDDSLTIGLQNVDFKNPEVSGYTIDWGDGSAIYSAGPSFSSKSHTYVGLGEFPLKYTVKDTNGCSLTLDSTIINESNPSVGVADNGATSGCAPQAFFFKLTAKNVSATTKFIWSFGDGTPTVTWDYTKALDSIQHTYTTTSCGHNSPTCTNCFVVSVRAINACDTTTGTVDNIKIYTKPKPNFSILPSVACTNSPVSFPNSSVSNCISVNKYKWFFGDGDSSALASPTHKYTKQGTYTVILIASNPCGTDTSTKTIEIDSVPVSNFSFTGSSGNPGCAPAVVNFKDSSIGKNIVYSWTVSPALGWSFTNSTTSTSQNPQITFSSANTYIVTLSVSNGCGTVSKSDTIVVPAKPGVTLANIPGNCGAYTFTPSASFNNEGSSITSYSWTLTGGSPSSSGSQSPGSVTYSSTGTYTVSISASNACGTTSDSKSFKVNAFPNAQTAPDQTICAGTTVNIGTTSVPGDTYSWSSVPSGFSSTSSNPNVSPLSTTSFILTETITATGCQKTDTVIITVNPQPSAIVGPNKSICSGKSVILGTSSVAGDTYSWTPSTGLSSTTVANPTASPASTTTYTLTEIITATGCKKSNKVKVTVNPLPAADAGPDQTICAGSSVNIGTITVLGSSYLWKPATGLSSTTVSNPTATSTSTTTYTLAETNSNGCVDSNSVKITVNPIPAAAPGNPATICAGQSASIGTTAVGGHTYSWSPSTGLSSSTVSNPTATPVSTTTYTITEKVTATGCTNSNTVQVTVNPLPSVNAGGPQTICKGQSATIGSSATGGEAYIWTSQPSGFTATSSSESVNPATITTYYLTATDTATGCKKTDSALVTVNPLPTPLVTGPAAVCAGDVDAYSTTHNTGNSYNWAVQGGTITSGASTSSITVSWGTGSAGRVSVLETSGTSCADSAYEAVTINPLPSANSGPNETICSGKGVTIGASSIPGNTYSWTPSTGLSSTTVSNPTASPTSTTTYTLTETVSATGCTQTNTVKVTVNPLPTADAGSNQTICEGASVSIGTATVLGSFYSWTSSPTGFSSTLPNPTVSPTTTTSYTITETNSYGCMNSNSITVTVNPLPAAPGNPATICAGQSASIGTTAVGGHTYSWSPSTGLSSSTVSNPTATPVSTTTYTITEKVTATGCTNSNTVQVTVNPLPSVNAGGPQTICKGQSATIGSSATGGEAYSWTSQPSGFTATSSSESVNPATITTYYLTATDTATGCKKTDSALVTVNPLPTPLVTGPAAVCAGDVDAYSTTHNTGNSYNWAVQGGTITSGASTSSITVSWGTGSAGRVSVLETSGTSCADSAYEAVTINPLPSANSGPNETICSGKGVTIGASSIPGNTYSWTPSTGLSSTTVSNPTASPTSTTTYTLTETVSATGCTQTNTVKVTVNPLPTADAGSNQTICEGASVSIGTATVLGSSYSWTSSPTGFSSTLPNPTVSPTTTTSYTITETNSNGCMNSNSITVTVNPLPAATGAPATICAGQSASIGTTAVGGHAYSWSPSTGLSSSTVSNPTATPVSTTTYTITEKVTATGCTNSNTVQVTVNPLPSVNAGGPQTICKNQSATIGSLSTGGDSYSWTSNPTGFTSTNSSTTVSPASTTEYYLTETITATGCKQTDSVAITVNPLPTPSVSGPAVCAGDVATYSTTHNAGDSYSWAVQGGSITAGSGTSAITIAWGTGSAGRVRVMETAGTGCSDSSFKAITINPLPVANAGSPATICNSKSAPIGSAALSGDTYTWTGSPSGFSSTVANPVVSPNSTTVYHLAVSNTSTGCKNADSVKITVNPLPIVSTALPDTFCNTSITALVSGSPSGGTWRGKGVTSGGAFTPSVAGAGIDTIWYIYTSPLTGCTDSAKHLVYVASPPNVVAGQNDTVCITASNYKLQNYSPSGGAWSGTGIVIPDTFSAFKAGAGIFTLTYTVGQKTCKVSNSKIVKVNALPIVNAGRSDSVCLNLAAFPLSGYSPSGGLWTGAGITDMAKGIFNSKVAGVGSHLLTYSYTDPKTFCSSFDTIRIKVLPPPSVVMANDTFQCKGIPAKFSATSSNTANYKWFFGDNSTGSGSSPKHAYSNTGTYTIILVSSTSEGCQDTLYSSIRIAGPPVADFSRAPYSGIGPLTDSFKNLSAGEINGYEWMFGNKDSSNNQSPGNEIYQQSYNGDTTYYITLAAKNRCGVSVHKDSVLVFALPKARFGTDRDEHCTPFTVHFSDKSTGGPTRYFWDFGNGKTDTVKDPPPMVYTTDSTVKQYTITLVTVNKYGRDTFKHIIIVLPKRLFAFFNVNDTEGCVPVSVQFTDFTKGETSVSWSFGDGDSSALQNPLHIYTKPGTYTAMEFVSDGCSFDTAQVQVIIHPSPPVKWRSIPNCVNDSMQFINQSSDFSGSKWSFGDGDSSIDISPKHVYLKTGNYWVTLTIQSLTYGCTSSFSDSVKVDTVPSISFSASPLSGCRPLNVKFTNTGSSNTFYSWDFGDGNTSATENPEHIYPDSGIYIVKFSIITPLGCTNQVRKNIMVFPYPHAKFSIAPDPVCGAPHIVQFHNQSIGATGYSWFFSNGISSTNDSPSVNFDSMGTYNAKLVAVNSYGCKDSITHPITIFRPPVAAFTPQPVGCQSAATYFKNTSAYMDRFLWNFGDTATDSVNASPSHLYKNPGSFVVTLNVIGDGGCTDKIAKSNAITIDPRPIAGFTFYPETNPSTGWVQFYADTTGIANYSWNWGDRDSTSGPNATNPKHKYDEPGTYTVKLVVTNKFGCIDTITRIVAITYFEGLFIPNAIAPNSGPPEERIFLPKASSLQSYKLQIYTTWGELLWENEDLANGHPATGWDGTTDGKPLAEGVYVWKITATFLNGQVWKGKEYDGEIRPLGTVTLVR